MPEVEGAAGIDARGTVLSFFDTHTSDRLTLPYFADGGYLSVSLVRLDRFLRDHRTGDEHPIGPALFDLLHELQRATSTKMPSR